MSSLNTLDACNPAFNATVSASAGSGKTWLLITRIVRLLLDGAEPGNIIALTFTRKAAGEMQIRLSERLYEMATVDEKALDNLLEMTGCELDTNTRNSARSLYEKIIHSLYPVRIQTFHSFCQDILSRFPLEADIPPGFELLEDTSLLQRQAWQMLFDEALQDKSTDAHAKQLNQELDSIMTFCNGPDNTHTAINSMLNHRSDWWAFTADSDAVDFACKSLARQLDIDEHSDPLSDFFAGEQQTQRNENLFIFSSMLRQINLKTSNNHADIIDQFLSLTNSHSQESMYEKNFRLIKSAFIKKDGDIMVQGRKMSNPLEKKLGLENAERFLELHHEIGEQILHTSELLLRKLCLQINKAWYYTGNRYIEIFQQLKRDMRLLDFNDLEWKCYQLLQFSDNAHWVQYKIDQRIDHILIDEFQDTNPTQWQLLSPILDEIAANPVQRPRSVFLVGDEKQSIYSFRRANPALQLQASQWLADNLGAKATPLDFSRRSSAAIINCVNEIFLQDDINAVMKGFSQHDTHLKSLPGKVVLVDLFAEDEEEDSSKETTEQNTDFRNPLQQPLELSTSSLRDSEAEYIASQIQQLVSGDEYITDNGRVRKVEYADIMILMRNRTHLATYENTLKRFGIPFIGSKKGGLLDNLEIQDLHCLLNTLITPYDNLALAQVLKSPIFSASDDDLITLASQAGDYHWYERLLQLTEQSPTKKLSKPLRRAASLLPHWQQLAQQLPVHDCLDKIFSEGDIINRYIAANRDENKQKVAANCQRFLELSLDTDSGRYPSITRFLQKLSHLKNFSQNPPEEPLSQSKESRVSLMTIHGSKGLEAPVVFLADCNSNSTAKNAYSSLVRWPADKNRPVNFQLQLSKDNTDQRTLKLQQDKNKEQKLEELNLLYVALTRAREQLYISGIQGRRCNDDSWYQIINNGLGGITEDEVSAEGTPYRIYRHLSYKQSDAQTVKPGTVDKQRDLDPTLLARLSTAIEQRPNSTHLIAPSLYTENSKHGESIDEPPTTGSSAENRLAKKRGNIIHKTLETLCNGADNDIDHGDLVGQLKLTLSAHEAIHDSEQPEFVSDCINEALSVFEYPALKEIFFPDKNTNCFNEMPLMYLQTQASIENKTVYGIIDRVIKTDDSIVIIDYKSHRYADNENLQAFASQFAEQLDYYRQGVLSLWPEVSNDKIKTGILFTHQKEIVWLE